MRFVITIILETIADAWWGGSTAMDEDKLMIFTATLRNRNMQVHFPAKGLRGKGLLESPGPQKAAGAAASLGNTWKLLLLYSYFEIPA